jgi:purine-binding chemotaxis protein CheW
MSIASSTLGTPHGDHAAGLPPETVCSLLRMAVGDDVLAVPIEDVREILQVSRLTPLPRTPRFVRGVMNLRGSVVPVIDLAARLGGSPTEMGRRSCIVVVEGSNAVDPEHPDHHTPMVMGLLVDAVFEVFDRAGHEIEPAPALGTRVDPHYLRGMTRAAGRLIGVLALPQVLAAQDLADCIAGFQPH